MNLYPDWLKTILDASGQELGRYKFGELIQAGDLAEEFVPIAEFDGGVLVVHKQSDQVIYKCEDEKIEVFAMDEKEFVAEIRREEAWEELTENMPATQMFGLGIILKSKTEAQEELTLGFKGLSRDSAMVIQGKMLDGEMLSDALNRELKETLEIDTYDVIDLIDDGGLMNDDDKEVPLFTVTVLVDQFDPMEKIGDESIGWIGNQEKEIVN